MCGTKPLFCPLMNKYSNFVLYAVEEGPRGQSVLQLLVIEFATYMLIIINSLVINGRRSNERLFDIIVPHVLLN